MELLYKRAKIFLLVMLAVLLLASCGSGPLESESNKDDALYQVSLLDALMKGYYDEVISLSELTQHGDTGIGTFDGLAGEMILLDGIVYQAKADGTVVKKSEGSTPFACVKNFHEDISLGNMPEIDDIELLKSFLDETIENDTGNFNCFYMAKISGDFAKICVRSVPQQEKPYRPLAEVAAEQNEFDYENISGTLVALYCPEYVSGINLPGWHIHFISQDESKGGHVLALEMRSGNGSMDITNDYSIILPESNDFSKLDFDEDLSEKTESVEQGK